MTVYLLHFNTPLKHARHYLGSCDDLNARLERHRMGNGARLMEVIMQAGITWRLARTWPGDRNFERRLKKRKNSTRLCPMCNPSALSHGNYAEKQKGLRSTINR